MHINSYISFHLIKKNIFAFTMEQVKSFRCSVDHCLYVSFSVLSGLNLIWSSHVLLSQWISGLAFFTVSIPRYKVRTFVIRIFTLIINLLIMYNYYSMGIILTYGQFQNPCMCQNNNSNQQFDYGDGKFNW